MTKKMNLNGQSFYNAVVAGANAIMLNKNELNAINVFPVADGDTGSNMNATVKSIVDFMVNNENLSTVAKSAADGALIGARGNSGMILAQFFYAFSSEIKQTEAMEIKDFIKAIKNASHTLSKVLINPVEGTLLTIIQSWSDSLEIRYNDTLALDDYASAIMTDVQKALARTPEQLPLLKEKGVVDSGAKGFYHFLEGITHFIKTGHHLDQSSLAKANTHPNIPSIVIPPHTDHANDEQFRYCCEALLRNSPIDDMTLKANLSTLGDSLIIAGGPGLQHLHLHTSQPEAFFSRLTAFGTVDYMKADDMQMQAAIVSAPKGRIAIVTDSIADLSEDFAIKQQVTVLPLHIIIDGVDYLDRIAMTTKRFYDINSSLTEQPRSSMPSMKEIESLFQFLLGHFESILVMSVSDKLSGTYNLFQTVAKSLNVQFKSDQTSDQKMVSYDRIRVVNTLKNSGAQGLLTMAASEFALSEQILSDKLSAQEALSQLVAHVEQLIPKTNILVAVNNTQYLARSGRVSMRAGNIVKAIGLKPIMTLDSEGNGKAYGATFSTHSTRRKIIKQIIKVHKEKGILQYNIVHAGCLDQAQTFASLVAARIGIEPAYISEISPIVSATAGEGAIAISYITK